MTVPHHGRNSGKDWLWEPTRQAIYLRDGDRCVACDVDEADEEDAWFLSVDHIDPRGGNEPTNLVTLCISCNARKRSLPLDRWTDLATAARIRAAATPLTPELRRAGRRRTFERRPARLAGHRLRMMNLRTSRRAITFSAEAPF